MWVEFSIRSFGTLMYDCVINTTEIFNFLSLINNSVTIEFSFLLLIITAIISPKTINILRSLSTLYYSLYSSTEYSIKALGSLKCFNPLLSLLLIKNWYLASYEALAYKYMLSISGWLFIILNNAFVFLDPGPPIINILYGWSGTYIHFKLCSVLLSFA